MSSQRLDIYGYLLLSEITANGVTSDPVPDVVGIAMNLVFLPSNGI